MKYLLTHTIYTKKFQNIFNATIYDLSVSLLYEEKLLGSLGTLIQNKDKFIEDSQILVCYSDNLTDIDLTKLVNYHTSHDGDATIGLFQSQNPSQCGIVELDYDDTVIGFEEKPDMPKGNLANAGIYVFNTSIFNDIEQYNININEEGVDIGNNLLPKLVGRMKGYMVPEYLIDIGSLQNYQQAIEYMTSRKSNFFNNIQFDKMR